MSKQIDLLEEISFRRPSGSDEEKRALEILNRELTEAGLQTSIEEFELTREIPYGVSFEVIEPEAKTYTLTGLVGAGTTPAEGITAELLYLETIDEIGLRKAANKFVFVNEQPTESNYEKLVKAGVAGFAQFSGSIRDTEENSDLDSVRFRDYWERYGKLPAFQIRIADALEILKSGATKVRFKLLTQPVTYLSWNLIATVSGTELPDEEIVVSAHYDSTPYSYGAWDNGAGAVQVVEAARQYYQNPGKRTVKFILFGSEEVGLKGSRAYLERHKDELSRILLNINIDVGGSYLGADLIRVTAKEEAESYVRALTYEADYSSEVSSGIMSTDSVNFSDYGIPAVFLGRMPVRGGGYMHTRYDTFDLISEKVLERETRFLIFLVGRLADAGVFPIAREIPQELKEKIKEYFGKGISLTEKEEKNGGL